VTTHTSSGRKKRLRVVGLEMWLNSESVTPLKVKIDLVKKT
jgi:hypothetical protein